MRKANYCNGGESLRILLFLSGKYILSLTHHHLHKNISLDPVRKQKNSVHTFVFSMSSHDFFFIYSDIL